MYYQRLISTLTACLLICGTAFTQWGSVTGNGQLKEIERDLSGFDAIEVGSGIDLYLTQGNSTNVNVIAEENILDRIVTEVSGNTLRIKIEGSVRTTKPMEVRVTLPTLKKLWASGGSDAFTTALFNVDDLDIGASGGSDISLELKARRLRCKSSGGSDVNLVGTATEFWAEASGGSDIKARKFIVDTCNVTASGGSDAWVFVRETLDATASGGSDVHYDGDPKQVKAEGGWSSDITKM